MYSTHYQVDPLELKLIEALLHHNKCHTVMALFFHELSFNRSTRLALARYIMAHRLHTHLNSNRRSQHDEHSNTEDESAASLIQTALDNLHKYILTRRPELIDTLSSRYYCNWSHMRKTYDQGHVVTNVFKGLVAEAKIGRQYSGSASAEVRIAGQLNVTANKLKVDNINSLLSPRARSIKQLVGSSTPQRVPQQCATCLNCISYFHQYDCIPVPAHLKGCVHFIDGFEMNAKDIDGQWRDVLEQLICSILNNRGCGYIFIGAMNSLLNYSEDTLELKYHAKGITINEEFTEHFPTLLKKVVTRFIAPQSIIKEYLNATKFETIFQISYIPVLINQAEFQARYTPEQMAQNLLNQNYDILLKGLSVVRIKIQMHVKPSCLFYVVTPGLAGHKVEVSTFDSTDTLVKTVSMDRKSNYRIQEDEPTSIYSKIMRKFRQGVQLGNWGSSCNLYSHEKSIGCEKPLILTPYQNGKSAIKPDKLMGEADSNKNQSSISNEFQSNSPPAISANAQKSGCKGLFGRAPINTFNHETLILVPLGKEEIYTRFINRLDELKINYDCYQIYQKLQLHSKRKAYYLTHEKKYDAMLRAHATIEDHFGDLLLFQVRKYLVLLNGSYDQLLSSAMTKHFKTEFEANISVGSKQSYNPEKKQVVHGVYCSFVHTMHALFAFIALENANIKCNFVNIKKLEGVTTKDI